MKKMVAVTNCKFLINRLGVNKWNCKLFLLLIFCMPVLTMRKVSVVQVEYSVLSCFLSFWQILTRVHIPVKQIQLKSIQRVGGGGGVDFYTDISSIYIQRRFLTEYCEMFTSFTPHTAFQRYHPNTFMSLAKRNPRRLSLLWLCTRLLALKPEESAFPNRKYGLFNSIE